MVSVLERLAITSRGFKEEDVEVAKLIVQVLKDPENTAVHDEVKAAVVPLTKNIHYITNIRDS